jgi:hypothetical protein
VTANSGVICANYLHLHGDFADCKGAWCARCYTHSTDRFRIRETLDDDGKELVDHPGGEEMCFLQARPGDRLMVPFQCEVCHFRNLTLPNPMASHPGHQDCLLYIRRCNLDSFWSRESSTVRAHLREALRVESAGARWGIDHMTPPIGPFSLMGFTWGESRPRIGGQVTRQDRKAQNLCTAGHVPKGPDLHHQCQSSRDSRAGGSDRSP